MNKANLELIYRKFSEGSLTKVEALQLIEATQPGAADCRLHPLVHHNLSDLGGLRFGATFSGDEFFLRDHRVQGHKVLPGVAYLEMARAAVGLAVPSLQPNAAGVVLEDVTWLAPMTVAGATEVAIHLRHEAADTGPGTIHFEIQSVAATPTLFARGQARCLPLSAPPAWDLAALRDNAAWRCLSGDLCYERFDAVGITYGAAHRVLETLWADQERVLAKLVLPSAYAPSLAQFQLQPALLDGALQAAIGLVDGTGAAKPSLPFALDAVEIYGALNATMWAWLRPADTRHAARLQKRDIDLCDENGQVRVRLKGLVSRVLQQDTAPATVAVPAAELVQLAPVWQTVAAPRGVAMDGQGLVIVGGSSARRQALAAALPGARLLEVDAGATLTEVGAALADITDLRHLVWLSTPAEHDDMIAAQEGGVYALFRIIKALVARNTASQDFALTVVTTNVHSIGAEPCDATHAAVHGLVGALAKEWPHWSVRLFDLARDQAWPLAQLFAFAPDPRGDVRVYRHGQWFQQQLAPLVLPSGGDAPYRLKGTYVVIGGAGGLGEVWTRQLVRDYGANVVWLGRRAEDDRIRRRLDALEQLGPRPLYLAVDCGDEAALRRARAEILRRFDAVHGLVHAALVLADESLVAMQETRFRAALHAKLATGVAAARVFAEDALDFVLFFSSLNAFEKSPGQANYAAACTFQDAFATHLRQCSATTVKVMNWGYWGGVGRVKDAFYQTRMARAGVGSIEPAEGLAALENLLCAPLDQAALAKVTAPRGDEQGGHERLTVTEAAPDCLAALQTRCDTAPAAVVSDRVADWCALGSDLEKQLAALLHERLTHLNLLSGDVALAPPYDRWLAESRRLLKEHGFGAGMPDAAALWARWEKRVHEGAGAEQAQAALVDVCLRALGDVLAGRKPATEVLFPNSSTALVEQVYKGAESANLFNDRLADVVAAYVAERRGRDPHCRLRFLEIGAGTGGTTISVLRRLHANAAAVAEYCFTDISKAFLFEAENRWQAAHPYLRTALFDVSADPGAQGFDLGAYDLVIATNVLHATADIRRTLRHGKALLRRHGLLCLNEMSRNSLYSHLTFGLLDGWWRYEDEALRMPGCPGLSVATWARVLGEEGLRGTWFPLEWAADLGQQVIVAASDGVVRRHLAEPASAPQPTPKAKAQRPEVPAAAPAPVAGDLRQRAVAFFKAMIGAALKLDPRRIDAAERLENYGLDSILSVQLTNRLGKQLDNISSTLFFEVPTVNDLVDELLAGQADKLAAMLAPEADAAEPTPVTTTAAPPRRAQPPVVAAPSAAAPHHRPAATGDIAILALNGRFPQAPDLATFWDNLKAGRDAITEVPAARWRHADFFDPEPQKPGKTHTKWGGFIEDPLGFDPLFFNISPREAELMDPKERLFLETVWHLFEEVGLTRDLLLQRYQRRVGVFVGAMYQQYHAFASDATREALVSLTSYASIANRVSQFFDLQGPSMAVDTMCSSSLVAIHQARASLLAGECTLAVAGGVNLSLHPKKFIGLSASNMIGSGPHSRSLAEGDGYLPAETVAAVLLKPLAQALADGDAILAVIKGSAVNHAGAGTGYSVPNPKAQIQLAAENYRQSDVDPRTVGYVEAAVNGSPQGDAIEINALKKFYALHADDVETVALGSVKSNIGHAEAASGMTQLAKVVLQLRHRCLVPTIKSQPRNPRIDLAGSPLHVPEQLSEWPAPADTPRRAAIASWGAAGSNAHLIVEEFPESAWPPQPAASGPHLIVLSARAEDRLPLMAAALADYLACHDDVALDRVAFTLQHHREAMRYRVAWVADARMSLIDCLRAFGEGRPGIGTRQGSSENHHQVADLLDGDAGTAFLQTLIKNRDLDKLADLWVQGAAVPWPQLHQATPAPLPLPLYPFCRQRYALGEIADRAAVAAPLASVPAATGGDGWLPWLQAAVADLLGLAVDQVPPQRPLIELGFGSLNGVQLKAALEKTWAVSVSAALLNGFQHLAALADELEQQAPFAARHTGDDDAPLLPTLDPQPALRYQPFPLSDIQQSYLLGRKQGGDAAIGCHIYLELQAAPVGLGGEGFDVYRLNQAWQQLIDHHDMLRTVFLANGTQQVLAEVEPYRFKVRDLRRVGAETRAATLAATRERMSHHVYAAEQWPLFEIRISICPNATLIHFSIDELLLDWSGLEMLFRQWHEHYQNPELVRPLPAVTFRDYMIAVKNFERTPRYQRDLAYRLETLADAAQGPALPAGKATITGHHCTRFEDSLDAAAWQRLKQTAAALQVTPTALLLSLFGEVLHAWCDQPSFLLILTYFNRTPLHADLERVLAPFISTTLFRADRPIANPADTIVATQQRLWDDLDHNSAGGIRVLRELKKRAGVAKDLSLPVVFTSLLGRDTGGGETLFAEITYSITQTPRVFLDHQVHERDGVLHYNWDVVEAAFAPGLPATLFAAYGDLLRQVAATPDCLQDSAWRATLQATPQPRINARPDAAHAPFPLTDQQQAYAFGRSKFGGNLSSQVYMFFDAEELDTARLTAAWRKVCARHAMLRAVILPNGTQQIKTDLPDVEITQHDLRDCETDALAHELEAVGAAMMANTVPLGDWPYCDLRVSLLPEGKARVHLSVDMIIADGTAINRLARELFENYAEPALTRPPLAVSFRDYVLYLQDYKQSAAYRDDVAYWETKFAAIPAGPALPRIGDGSVHATESFESLLRGWPHLVEAARQREVAEGMILLAVYGEVLSAWCGGEPFTLVIPCWQRLALHPQLDEVVGDFTAMSWVVVQNDGRSFEEKVQAYHQTVNADLAHMAVSGLGALRKQVAKRGKAAPLGFPVVFTNMGGPTRFNLPDGIRFGGYLSQTSQVHMDNISLENDGALQFRWDVAKGVFPDGLITEMFAGYQRFLVALADDPKTWTQRDFSALIQAKPVKYQRLAAESRALAMEEV